MAINTTSFDKPLSIDTIPLELSNGKIKQIDILRLDQVHETISGNKWFKLKYNLLEAANKKANSILSFGGAYSNHLHALAYAGEHFNIPTIGIVRGEEVKNETLNECRKWGMELEFISRTKYRLKNEEDYLSKLREQYPNSFIVPEGGDNTLGKKGCQEILSQKNIATYDMVCCSVGTGTTILGIKAVFDKEILGFAPFKNAHSLKSKIESDHIHYIDDYHFGGFGKMTEALERFMCQFKTKYSIELDRIYTAKMFFGLTQLLTRQEYSNKKILAIHTGGLQGNRSMR